MPRIAIAGASGLLGSRLVRSLERSGHEVVRLVRRAPVSPSEAPWDPPARWIPADALAGCDAVVNLAGESISKRWTKSVRERIVSSRVQATSLLAGDCARLGVPLLVSASAVGIYGDRGEELLQESSPSGGGFLAETCLDWEHAHHPARLAGVRTVSCRFGVVLSRRGGALPGMLMPFRLGMGGPIGSGRQWMSWIHEDDAVGVVERALADDSIQGPLLAVAPEPIRQADFAKALGKALRRPSFVRTPAWLLRLALGEMADELLLASQRCQPLGLACGGFRWKHPTIEAALADLFP